MLNTIDTIMLKEWVFNKIFIGGDKTLQNDY